MSKFYLLSVVEVKKETNDAISIALDISKELYNIFSYKPGQFVTLKFTINGKDVRRSYSLCSTPALEEFLRIGVKRVKDGLVSNHINDNLHIGDTVEVMPPDGRFFASIKKGNYKTYYLFAAGSGITPILSILKTVLLTEKRSFVYILYGNSNEETIMFKEELSDLQKRYSGRLILAHTLSKAKSSFWPNKKKIDFLEGRVNVKNIRWFINEYPPYAQNSEYYICGPDTMIKNAQDVLMDMDVPKERIFMEYFGSKEITNDTIRGVINAKLIAHLKGERIETEFTKGRTVLASLLANGNEPPYSCEGGVCSTCLCKLKQGKVRMHKNLSLSKEEINKGYILSCQSIPMTNIVEVVYE